MSAALSCARRVARARGRRQSPPRPASRRYTSPDITATPAARLELHAVAGSSAAWDDNVRCKGRATTRSATSSTSSTRAPSSISTAAAAARRALRRRVPALSHVDHAEQLRPARDRLGAPAPAARRTSRSSSAARAVRGADDRAAAARRRAVRAHRIARRGRAGRRRSGAHASGRRSSPTYDFQGVRLRPRRRRHLPARRPRATAAGVVAARTAVGADDADGRLRRASTRPSATARQRSTSRTRGAASSTSSRGRSRSLGRGGRRAPGRDDVSAPREPARAMRVGPRRATCAVVGRRCPLQPLVRPVVRLRRHACRTKNLTGAPARAARRAGCTRQSLGVVAAQRAADRRSTPPLRSFWIRGARRLRGHAVGAHRRVLRGHASDHRPPGGDARPQSDRRSRSSPAKPMRIR